MDSRRHTRYRRRYKGNIKRIRQRNRRLGIFLLAVFVAIAGVTNIVRTKHREAAAQAYAEKQAEKENQKAKEQEDSGLKLADEKEKEQWYLKLVNAKNPMTQEDVPEVATETIDSNGYQVDARIMGDLEDMFAAARAAGRNPVICSAFRAWETQEYLYQNKIQRVMSEEGLPEDQAAVEAGTVVAVPGTSEHQIGLALDIVDPSYQSLDDAQAKTDASLWLAENAADYGFILRYPKDKVDLTGIDYESWHYRYVGKDAALFMKEHNLCLEEFIELAQKQDILSQKQEASQKQNYEE